MAELSYDQCEICGSYQNVSYYDGVFACSECLRLDEKAYKLETEQLVYFPMEDKD